MLTAQEVKSYAEGWLEPISAGEPSGQNAAYDPRYAELRNKMVALDSPTGNVVEWPEIMQAGRDLLTTATKDLLIASYSVYAMFETNGLEGLAVGLELIQGLLDKYWDSMFPPAKRLRGRGNALDWLVARLELALPNIQVQPADRPVVELVQAQWKAVGATAREKLGEHCPAMGGVDEALTRILMKLPAPPPEATAPNPEPSPIPNPNPEASPNPNPNPSPSPSIDPARPDGPGPQGPAPSPSIDPARPDGPGPQAPAPAAEAAPPPAPPSPAPAPAAPAANPDDPIEKAKAAAAKWLEPLSPDPAGADPRYEEEFQEAKAEVGKLDTPTTDQPQWPAVWRFAETVLQSKGKDLLMAGYLAYGLYQDRGLTALPTGLMLVVGFVDQYADTMFPSRPRGRSNALAWFTDHLEKALAQENPTPDQRELVITIDRAVKELADVARDKMGDAAPGMSPLRERMQRMLLAVPEKKPQAPPPPKPAAPSPAQPQAQAARPAASAPAMPAVSGDISSAEDVTKFLIDTGKSLVTAAGLLRRADASTPAAYRLIRTGLWLHLSAAPPADAGGKTNVPGLPEARRKQFETILANGKWLAALEETESALQQFRFCLDLNRMSHQALTALGDTHKHAAEAVAAETATLLRRMPDLIDLSAGDGTPFADNETRAWIADNAGSGGGAGPARSTGDDGVPAEALAELRGLMKTKPQDGMKRGMELINAASSPRSKLLCRLALAEACLDADQGKLARGMFAAIDREMQDRGLQDWDPPLVGRCLEGFMRSIRAAAKAGSPYQGSEEIFERLCLVDPAAAAKLG